MRRHSVCKRSNALYAGISSILIASRSIVRGLFLFISARPRTPLRVLCIMAMDSIHMRRFAKPLPMRKLRALAALLDFGACANAALDDKHPSQHEFRTTLQLLEEAGIGSSLDDYLRRLARMETTRPLPGGDVGQFHKVMAYREAVVRLYLGMLAVTASVNQGLDEAIHSTVADPDLSMLFRIAMQCQIIDDVFDYSMDNSAGLPSVLTACKSLPRAFELTRLAARGYADQGDLPQTGDLLPFRIALRLVSTCTSLAIVLGRWRQRRHPETILPMERAMANRP